MDRQPDPDRGELVEVGYVRGSNQALTIEALLRGEGIRYELGSPGYGGRSVMVDPARAKDASARLDEVQARVRVEGESRFDPAAKAELGPGLDQPTPPWGRSGWPYFLWQIRVYLVVVAIAAVAYGLFLLVRSL
jgi:hypothetical protein